MSMADKSEFYRLGFERGENSGWDTPIDSDIEWFARMIGRTPDATELQEFSNGMIAGAEEYDA